MIRIIKDLLAYHQRGTRTFASHDFGNVFKKTLRDLSKFGFNSIEGKTILDLGCGQRFPFSLLAAASGARVTALDINYVKPDFLLSYFWHIFRTNGLKRAFRAITRRVLFDKLYYAQLESISGKSLSQYIKNIEFIIADPTSSIYPLPDSSYDLITSNAVLEHVADVPTFFSEVHRILKTNGYFYGIIHNFFSLSGGHNLQWAFPDSHPSETVPPWDHLRENRFPTHVYLNRLKPKQYETIASRYLQVLLFEARDINHDPGKLEGERFLTQELQATLQAYPRDLLLTRNYCIICQKN